MLIPIILSGGVGSRLWPLSRKSKPKHFMPLIEDHIDDAHKAVVSKSLFQQTLLRCSSNNLLNNTPFSVKPVMICDSDHRFLLLDQCRDLNIIPEDIIVEPCRKDTAAAILLAALYMQSKYSDPALLVLPSDHYMSDNNYFTDRIASIIKYVENNNHIVTFGITATYPETAYGYINYDRQNSLDIDVHNVKRFIEKPKYTVAKKLLDENASYWNSGMYMFKASKLIEICKEFQPELLKYCEDTMASYKKDNSFVMFSNNSFNKINPISIDYAVMEDTKDMIVAKYDGQWTDVGSWHGIWQSTPKDKNNNVMIGDILSDDLVDNCYLRSDYRLIVASNIQNLVVIETADAILVANLDGTNNIKNIVEKSIKHNKKEFIEHSHVHKPWGEYYVYEDYNNFKVKKLVIKPGASISLQEHKHRSEHWIIAKGRAEVILGEENLNLMCNDNIYIPIATKHKIINPSQEENLIIIEVQIGDYLGEDDIIRYQDDYGRVKK